MLRSQRIAGFLASLSTLVCAGVLAQGVAPVAEPPAASGWKLETVADGLPQPWGMAWLADGRLLVTGKKGTLHLVDGKRVENIAVEGLPALFTEGQGGLLDIAVHPRDKGRNPRVYMTMASGTSDANRTVLVQGVFDGKRVHGIKTLFTASPSKSGGQHFGSRIVFLKDGTLLMSIGDGGNPPQRVGDMLARDQAQNVGSHNGAILRLTDSGRPAPGNPLAGQQGALPELWSIGHRNIQGIAADPQSGRVWASEHGPRGGDEINVIEGGKNYGWPLQSYGLDYKTREPVGRQVVPGMVQPIVVWTPSTGASGLAWYTGQAFPAWRGSLFSGGLATEDIRRVAFDAQGRVVKQERLAIGKRVRDVRQGPDGQLYALTDEAKGSLLRIVPD
ncbi:PQQ-dependent sugar dehydrogenase [Massilia sp. MS-15]|uniref:PQQ-dependent sugar dehydrogenase n=1 Tax=Massilia sp. MS-15 TaxID=2878200 RepID=UPI001CD23FFA|nr:PQQ-dependent sugar dehydrogenase [Massilia sp. MS-15]MCA1247547.1 PQQ-dependent sugar dehydrogenase [Massilia sp. MS-15]